MSEQEVSRCGYVAIVGRPNVGKSTLLNHILGQKLAITSRKPQTTRHRILGIDTDGAYQTIYVDTPGLHQEEKRAINRLMNRAATSSLGDVEMVVFVVDGTRWTDDDEHVLSKLRHVKCPVVLAINKIDLIDDKELLLPHIQMLAQKMNFAAVLPLSAEKGTNVDKIRDMARELAQNCLLRRVNGTRIVLSLAPAQRHLLIKTAQDKLQQALSEYHACPVQLTIEIEDVVGETPAAVAHKERQERQAQAEESIDQDEFVREAVALFDAKVVEDTTRPF